MLAPPPNTRWQDAACSRAEPSPGRLAYTMLDTAVDLAISSKDSVRPSACFTSSYALTKSAALAPS